QSATAGRSGTSLKGREGGGRRRYRPQPCFGLLDPELLPGVSTQAFRCPGGAPDDIHMSRSYARELFQPGTDLIADLNVGRAALGCEGHFYSDILLFVGDRLEAYFVNQTQIDDIHWDFGVVT